MKEVLKKILALTLALVMVVGLAPAFEQKAEATEAQATAEPWTYDPATAGKTFDQFWQEAYNDSNNNGDRVVTIQLAGDVTTSSLLELQNDAKITLNLNGYTLERDTGSGAVEDGQVFRVWDGSVLTINGGTRTVGDKQVMGTITGAANRGNGGAFYLEEDAELVLNGVTMFNNQCTRSGAAVYAKDDAKVTVTGGSLIGTLDRFTQGNISAIDFGETGGAFYMDDDSSLLINNATISRNQAVYGSVGAIYWGANGTCQLINVVIMDNTAYELCGGVYVPAGVYDTDIYLGGKVVIHNNRQGNGSSVAYGTASNLYLLDDDANINRCAQLDADSKIGITYGDIDDDSNDCLTASDSNFAKADLSYFYYDLGDINGNVLRKVDQGTKAGSNQWALYATKPGDSNNEIPEITAAAVNTAYATSTNAVIDNTATDDTNRSVTLTVKKDSATKQFVRYAALRDFAVFGFREFDTKILESAVAHDFVSTPTKTYTVMTPNGTFEYWDITVVPEGGVWDVDPCVAEVNGTQYASFDTAWAAALNTPGSTLTLHADWLAGDMNSNGVFDPAETAGKFAGSAGAYRNGALYVDQNTLTIDLNGYKIDRMGGNDSVFYVQGSELTIMDSSEAKAGKITGSKGNGNGGAFYVTGDSRLYIYGGTITGNTAYRGAGIYTTASTVEIYGGTITGNSAENEGGAIYTSQSWLRIYGGKITNNKAATGGAISISWRDKAFIYGGEISGNTAIATNVKDSGRGGAIYIGEFSEVTIGDPTINDEKVPTDRIISGNSAKYGGAIYVKGSDLTITDSVSISGNSASEQGGGIYVDYYAMSYNIPGTVTMKSAIIEENTAKRGGGVYVNDSAFTMKSGEIRGNKASDILVGGAGVYVNGGTFTADGGSISQNTTSANGGGVAIIGSANFNLNGATIANNRGAQGGGVYFNGSGNVVLLSGSITGNSNGFWAANSASGKISVGGTIKITGNTLANLFLPNKNVDLHHFTSTPLTDGAEIGVSLNPGEYGDDNEDRITAENGNFFEKSYPYFFSDDASYRIANREKKGWTFESDPFEADRWHLHLVKVGTAADERPVIKKAYLNEMIGTTYASVYQDRNVIDLRMQNSGDNKSIVENISMNKLAAFVFEVPGTEIVGGDEMTNFVENPTHTYMVKTPNGTYDYWTIRVMPHSPWRADAVVATVKAGGVDTPFTTGVPTQSNPNKGFAAAWEFAKNTPGSTLTLHADWLAGDTNNNGRIDDGDDESKADNFTSGSSISISSGDVTIDLNGHKIDRMGRGIGSIFSVQGGNLTIKDSVGTGIITGGKSGAFFVNSGQLILESGSITGNSSNGKGSAIYVKDAAVTITGGSITGNTAPDGGAICVDDSASVTITGGSISNNEATGAVENTGSGGAIYMLGTNATVTMNGGTITGNKAKFDGAGVYILNGTFNFGGGTIEKNTATVGSGGGVFVGGNGEFNFANGYIQNNAVDAGNGGGVQVNGNGIFNFTGGYIQKNTANSGSGGGVHVTGKGKIYSTGGYIQNNTANSGYGGGVFIGNQNSALSNYSQLKNTFVIGNSATEGGGIAFHEDEERSIRNTIKNVIVHDNTATKRGGGIYINFEDAQHVEINGCQITENKAAYGAGICDVTGVLSLLSSTVTGNIASVSGGGVFMDILEDIFIGGTTVIDGNVKSGNAASNLHLSGDGNDIGIIGTLGEGSSIGVTISDDYYRGNNYDEISEENSSYREGDGYYFHPDHSSIIIAMEDLGEDETNRYRLYFVRASYKSSACPGITGATAKNDSFKPLGDTPFAQIDEATRTLTLTVNNTYKHIFENLAFEELVTIDLTSDDYTWFADENALTAKRNFVSNPSAVYQIIHNDDWYSLWTIEVVPEGGAWSDTIGNVASVTYRGKTDYYYDMEMAYLDALAYSVMPGGTTLTLNQDWLPNSDEGFDYDEGTDDGCLYLNDSNINLIVDLNGHTISRGLSHVTAKTYGQAFFINNGSLTIMDSSEAQTGKITGCHTTSSYFGGGAIYVGNSGRLTLNGGSITNNYTSYYGGAIYLEDNARFIMNGGSISNNTAGGVDYEGYGGGVYMQNNAAFTMNGGEIYWNKSEGGNGGGIYMIDSAAFTMNGGTIIKNHAYANDDSEDGNGGGIYASDTGAGVTVTMNGGEISDNYSENNGSGIYWLSDDDGKLYLNGGTITGNNAGGVGCGVYADDDGSDPYVGGTIRIIDNLDADASGRTIQSNMYLADDDSNLNQNTGNRLREGARIGIRFGYDDEDDYFSASDSRFTADSVSYFFADDTNYIVRMEVSGSGGNSHKLYLTRADESEAANSQAAIVGAEVNSTYATTFAPVFENNVAKIPVNPDAYITMRDGDENGKLCLNDVVSLTFSAGAHIDDASVLTTKADLTAGVNVKVRAADGSTVMTWTVKVVPGNDSGEWNSYTVNLSGAEFYAANAGNRYYPGEKVYLRTLDSNTKQFKGWRVVDLEGVPTLDSTTTEIEDDYSFTMPANNVTVTADYYNVISDVAVTLGGAVEPKAAFPVSASYFANQTQQGVGKVSVAWKQGANPINGTFGYNTTYTAVVTIDLSKEDNYLAADSDKITATVNGVAVSSEKVTVSDDKKTLVLSINFTTAKARVIKVTSSYSTTSEALPGFTNGYTSAVGTAIMADLNANHNTVSAVTEDPNITSVNVTWITARYISGDGYVTVGGIVDGNNNSNLDVGDGYAVLARVYPKEKAKVADPVISITHANSAEQATVTISCATEGATVYYTTDGSDPQTGNSTTSKHLPTSGTFTVPTPKGYKTPITIKAFAIKSECINSNVTVASEIISRPYTVTVTGAAGHTVSDSDGLFHGEDAVITVTPAADSWISSIDAGSYGKVNNSNSITVKGIKSDVTVTATCRKLVTSIDLGALNLIGGKPFPALAPTAVGDGYTVSIDWNTSSKTVAYGATYHPTIRIAAVGSSIPFASNLTMTLNDGAITPQSSTDSVKNFTATLTAANDKLTAVTAPGNITINQGEVLNLPQAVSVTTTGKTITSASVTWNRGSFNANVPGAYTITGTLVLPASVEIAEDATGFDNTNTGEKTISLTVTVNALPQLSMPNASTRTETVIQKIVNTETGRTTDGPTVRATVVDLSSTTAGATVYYTMSFTSATAQDQTHTAPADPVVGSNATQYDPSTGIVLDTSGTYTIKAVVYKANYTTSDVATFNYSVTAPGVYTIKVYNWVNGRNILAETRTAAEGETVSFVADGSIGLFSAWDVEDNKWKTDANGNYVDKDGNPVPNQNNKDPEPDDTWETATFGTDPSPFRNSTLRFTMPASNIDVTGVYVARINTVNITGLDAPVAYKPFDTLATSTANVTDSGSTTTPVNTDVAVTWTYGGNPVSGTAEYGETYTGTIVLQSDIFSNIAYAQNMNVTGLTGARKVNATVAGETVTITFDMTAGKVKMNAPYSVTAENNVLTVANGTTEAAVKAQIERIKLTMSTEAGMIPINVTWRCEGTYNPTPAQEATYIFAADLSDAVLAKYFIDRNGQTVSARVTVKVAAPEVTYVAMPTVNVDPGSYNENKTVTLSCGTQGAEIYCRVYNNEAPGANDELTTEYASAITLEGAAGQTKTFVIRAAAKVGEGNSAVWSDVATYRYTITLPANTYTVNVVDGDGDGSYKPGDTVTVNAPQVSGTYFVGWTVTGATIPTAQLKNRTLSFTMPANDVTLTANYAGFEVTRVDLHVTAPVAGSALPAKVGYDVTYQTGTGNAVKSTVYRNECNTEWKTGNDVKIGIAQRNKTYTLSVTIPYITNTVTGFKVYCNGREITSGYSIDNNELIYTCSFDTQGVAYISHVNPAPITGVEVGATLNVSMLPTTVSVIAEDTKSEIAVDWTVPTNKTFVANETVTVSGKLNATALAGAHITGGENAVVTVYVSSVARQEVAAPTATPVSGTEHLDSVSVILSSATSGATIYYTTDGSTPTASSTRYTAPIKLTKTTTIKAIAMKSNMDNSTVEEFTYTITPTYQLTVVNGSGSGKYQVGEKVDVKANKDVDNYFTVWTASSALTWDHDNDDSTAPVAVDLSMEDISFIMPANAVTLTANYAPKVNKVELTVDAQEGKSLPGKNDIGVIPADVTVSNIIWNEQSSAGSTLYAASITIKADHGFAEHGDVFVNGNLVPSVMNEDGSVTLTYQTLIGRRETYVSHDFVSAPITDVSHGTDLSNLLGKELPTEAVVTTDSGTKLTAAIRWDFAGCTYDKNNTAAQTFTLQGEIVLPAGVVGTNPQISVEISVLAKPYVPVAPPSSGDADDTDESDVPCDGGEECPHHDFSDLDPSAWYHSAVDYVLEKGMMSGVGDGKFNPNGETSRAMLVSILWRLEGKPAAGNAAGFSDVPDGQWYSEAVRWAAANGIVTGYDGKFDPNGDISREQLVSILFRYAKRCGIDISVGEDTNILSYADAFDVSDWAVEAVQWAVGSGLMKGDGVSLTPNANATRSQSAALLMRFCEEIMKAKNAKF